MELAIMNKSWHNNDNIMNSEAVSQPAPLYRRILWSMPFRVLFGLGVPAAALAGFALATGARVLVKFTVTNSAANPTLDVNGTGAKPIQYRGAAIAAGTLAANRTYGFVYTGAQYELVGDVDTNTTYPLATASNDGLMAKGDKGKLDGIAVGAEVNQNAFGNILVGSTTIAADTKTDTLTFVAGTNVTLTPDAANDKLTIAANLGKWRPNAANPTGLYVPKLSDQFFPRVDGGKPYSGFSAGGRDPQHRR